MTPKQRKSNRQVFLRRTRKSAKTWKSYVGVNWTGWPIMTRYERDTQCIATGAIRRRVARFSKRTTALIPRDAQAISKLLCQRMGRPTDRCRTNFLSSRMCELGTKSCTVIHMQPESPFPTDDLL